jgi:hypothetical protein
MNRSANLPRTVYLQLRLENAAVAAVTLTYYHTQFGHWWLFLALILVPDAAMIGYVKGPKLGALLYNIVHSYTLAIAITALGHVLQNETTVLLGTILIAHIALDRALGFGLKLPTGFGHTHLSAQIHAAQTNRKKP